MKKFIIEHSERDRILGMHKSLLKEQVTNLGEPSLKDQLQKFIDDECFPSSSIVTTMKTTNPKKQYAIKVESSLTPGKFRYYFIDNTAGQIENGVFTILPGKWPPCDPNTSKKAQQKNAENKTLGDAVLKEKKDKEGWMEYSELIGKGYSQLEADQGKYATEQFKLKTGETITLYKPKTGAVMGGQQQGMSAEQQAFITAYEGKGGKLKLTPEEQASQTFRQILIPGSKEITGWENTGLKMYFSVDVIKDIAGESGELKTTIENQIIPLNECKEFVDQFFRGYDLTVDIPKFDTVKSKVQRCKQLYSPNPKTGRKNGWGMFSDQKNKIDILSGLVTNQGPSSFGKDSKWRLE